VRSSGFKGSALATIWSRAPARPDPGSAARTRVKASFDHLDACEITSAAYVDNPASLGVSRKVGFVANGTFREQRREGEVAVSHKLLLTRDAFVRGPHPLHAEGVEPLRRFIGLE